MLGMSVSKSPSTEGDHGAYEYGEYDGLLDVDTILHSNAAGGGAGTLTPTASSIAGGSDLGGYANYLSLHGGEQSNGSTPVPPARGVAPRKPPRGSASQSRNGTPRHPAALVKGIALEPGDSLELSTTAGAATANGRLGGVRKLPTTTTDDVVHLPAIANAGISNSAQQQQQQGRKRTNDAAPPPRTSAAASAHSPSNNGHASNTHAMASGAKSVTSAGNLKSLQAGANGDGGVGAGVGANSNNYVAPLGHPSVGGPVKPPFHAPPLAGLNGKGRQPNHPSAGDEASLASGAKTAAAVLTTANGGGGSSGVSANKTNGWVKEEARRIDRRASVPGEATSPMSFEGRSGNDAGNGYKLRNMAQLAAAEFPRERMKEGPGLDEVRHSRVQPADTAGDGDNGHGAEANPRAKVNTSPAPVTPRAQVWAGDYGIGSNLGAGSADFSVVPMPKVAPGPRPFAGGLKPAAASGSGQAPRPHPSTQSPPRAGAAPITSAAAAGTPGNASSSSPTESIITPLRKVFPRPQKPATMGVGAAAGANTMAGVLPHVPLTHPPTSAPGPSRPAGAAAAAAAATPADGNGSPLLPSKAASASPHLAGATAAGKAGGLHTPNLSHRRIVMNAVDTSQHSHLHSSVGAEQLGGKTPAATAGPSRVIATSKANALPYTDERRAALEAWANVPVLAVTIRTQAPTPTQRAREAARTSTRPSNAKQMCVPVNGQGRQEVAGEPFEMNYDVHNVVVQLRHRNRPLMMNYPPRLPLEVDMRPRMRRQRTPRSFYGDRKPHVGDTWFRDALHDARMVQSPNIEEIEKREEAEFIQNGGDPTTRRNRYGQSNNTHGQQQQQQNRAGGGGAGGGGAGAGAGANGDDIDAINRNAVRMEQPAA